MESSVLNLVNLEKLPALERRIAARLLLRMGYDLYSKDITAYERNLSTLLQLFGQCYCSNFIAVKII
jgi:hypothetical protein